MKHLLANWPAPPGIHAFTTTRMHGVSRDPYFSNNLALHVNDCTTDVLINRQTLMDNLNIPGNPAWLDQTHSTLCVHVEQESNRQADAAFTRQQNQPLVILTADCLPILICNRLGTEIAAIHAGWRGLANGVIENTLARLQSPAEQLMAWIGPAICQSCYQVGEDTRDQIITQNNKFKDYFRHHDGCFYADLNGMATNVLREHGVLSVYLSNTCTFEHSSFYSYRMNNKTGRMATFIWS